MSTVVAKDSNWDRPNSLMKIRKLGFRVLSTGFESEMNPQREVWWPCSRSACGKHTVGSRPSGPSLLTWTGLCSITRHKIRTYSWLEPVDSHVKAF